MWRDGGKLDAQLEHLNAMKEAGAGWVRLSLIYQTNLDENLFAILRRCNELDIKVLMVIENRPQLYPVGAKRRPGSAPPGQPAWPCCRLSEIDLVLAEAYLSEFRFKRYLYQLVGEQWHWTDKLSLQDDQWRQYAESDKTETNRAESDDQYE